MRALAWEVCMFPLCSGVLHHPKNMNNRYILKPGVSDHETGSASGDGSANAATAHCSLQLFH